jgi:transposase InsO family protein
MEQLYKMIGETRQNHHQKLMRSECKRVQEKDLVALVNKYRIDHPRMGSRPLYYLMSNSGEALPTGLTLFEKFMSRKGLTIPKMKTRMPVTSDGKGKEAYENLTNGLIINGLRQLVVCDITYYDISECRCYLFILKDVYSQKALGLVASRNLNAENAEECIVQMCLEEGAEWFPDCIHHSDNGSQYNAKSYKQLLFKLGMRISRAESCVQNGSMEQMNHIAKNMYLDPWSINTFEELKKSCKRFVKLNNEQRPIKQLKNLSPNDFEKLILTLPEVDRPKKKLYDFKNWT